MSTQSSSILYHFINHKTCNELDRFIDARSIAHKNYDGFLYSRKDFEILKCGFIEDGNNYFLASDKDIIRYNLSSDFKNSTEIKRFQPEGGSILNISQNNINDNLFIIGQNDSTTFYNSYNESSFVINSPNKHICCWLSGTNRFVDVNNSGTLNIYDLEKQEVNFTKDILKDITIVSPHNDRDYILISDGKVVHFLDIRDEKIVRSDEFKKNICSITWLNNNYGGAVLGFENGEIQFFSLEKFSTTFSQKISDLPITCVDFCPDRFGTVLICSGPDILFGNLKAWGMGRLAITKKHEGHIGRINNASWCKNESLKVISCDNKSILNLFKICDGYLPLSS